MSQEPDTRLCVSAQVVEDLQREIPFAEIIKDIRDMRGAVLANGQRDWRAVEIADKLWLSYVIGLPLQRQHILQEKRTSAPPMDEIIKSPAAREKLARDFAASEEGREAMRAALAVVDV